MSWTTHHKGKAITTSSTSQEVHSLIPAPAAQASTYKTKICRCSQKAAEDGSLSEGPAWFYRLPVLPLVQCHQPQMELKWKWPKHQENWPFGDVQTSEVCPHPFSPSPGPGGTNIRKKQWLHLFDARKNEGLQIINITVCSSNTFNRFSFISVTICRGQDCSHFSFSHFPPRGALANFYKRCVDTHSVQKDSGSPTQAIP